MFLPVLLYVVQRANNTGARDVIGHVTAFIPADRGSYSRRTDESLFRPAYKNLHRFASRFIPIVSSFL